ncbi:MAG: cyclase family protein [Armatimonadota bacterium]
MIYDISLTLEPEMPIYPGDAPYRLEPMLRIADGAMCNLSRLEMGTHTGTHIDAPWHFNEQGKRVEQIPLDRLVGLAWVADLRGHKVITAKVLQEANIPLTTRLLLKTDNSALWQRREFQKEFVYLSADAADWLIAHTISVVGLDYLSVEQFGAPEPIVHRKLCGAGIVIIEGLNLSEVPEGEYELICMPLKLKGADGAPARVALRTG